MPLYEYQPCYWVRTLRRFRYGGIILKINKCNWSTNKCRWSTNKCSGCTNKCCWSTNKYFWSTNVDDPQINAAGFTFVHRLLLTFIYLFIFDLSKIICILMAQSMYSLSVALLAYILLLHLLMLVAIFYPCCPYSSWLQRTQVIQNYRLMWHSHKMSQNLYNIIEFA